MFVMVTTLWPKDPGYSLSPVYLTVRFAMTNVLPPEGFLNLRL